MAALTLLGMQSIGAVSLGVNSLVTWIAQMQASVSSTASAADDAAMAAVADDHEQACLAMAVDRKHSADLHLKLLTRLDADSTISKLPPLPTLTGKSDWSHFWETPLYISVKINTASALATNFSTLKMVHQPTRHNLLLSTIYWLEN